MVGVASGSHAVSLHSRRSSENEDALPELGAAMVVLLSTTASLLWAQDALTITEQPLQPGDALRVSFSMETVLNGIYYVGEDGQVNLPILGSRPATEDTPSELKLRLMEEYRRPTAESDGSDHVAQKGACFGAVNVPGLYRGRHDGLADAIPLAGGATPIGKLNGSRSSGTGWSYKLIFLPKRSWESSSTRVIRSWSRSGAGRRGIWVSLSVRPCRRPR